MGKIYLIFQVERCNGLALALRGIGSGPTERRKPESPPARGYVLIRVASISLLKLRPNTERNHDRQIKKIISIPERPLMNRPSQTRKGQHQENCCIGSANCAFDAQARRSKRESHHKKQ